MKAIFRKIRHQLLTKNKFSRYLLYAVGEIILVVIGILIALQINNVNDSKKARVQEINQLKNIQEDMALDTSDVLYNLRAHQLFLSSEQDLFDYLLSQDFIPSKNIKYDDALGTALLLTLHESAFLNLRNDNLNIITNLKLKKEISNYYDSYVKFLLIIENDKEDTYWLKRSYFLKHFHYQKNMNIKDDGGSNELFYFNPNIEKTKLLLADTLGIKKDEEFKLVLAESIRYRKIKIEFYKDFIKRNIALYKAIDSELLRLEN